MHVRGWHTTSTPSHVFKQDREVFAKEIENLSFQRKRLWYRSLKYGETDFVVALLINKCHDLRRLSLDFDPRDRASLVGMLLLVNSIESHNEPGLPRRHLKLEEVEFVCKDPEDEYDEGAMNN